MEVPTMEEFEKLERHVEAMKNQSDENFREAMEAVAALDKRLPPDTGVSCLKFRYCGKKLRLTGNFPHEVLMEVLRNGFNGKVEEGFE